MASLEVQHVSVRYGTGRRAFNAIEDVTVGVSGPSTLGVVGESGSGKSTLARAMVGLAGLSAGKILLDQEEIAERRRSRRARAVQMVFQDAHSSLNPRMTVGEAIDEAIAASGSLPRSEIGAESERLLNLVTLDPRLRDRFRHQFSGGQLQRVAIARSLAAGPSVLLLDEVTSALDVSVQATIIALLRELQSRLGLSYVVISHDLAVVRSMSDRIAVMYLGQIVEHAAANEFFATPGHPYTTALIASVPSVGPRPKRDKLILQGDPPDPRRPPRGCRFHTRCPVGPLVNPERSICQEVDPHELPQEHGHWVACHFRLDRPRMAT